jgi:hypothetical protein
LFLDAGEPRRALEHFQRSLRVEPENQAAIAGAGEAAFEAGDYTGAQRYLRSVTSPSDRVSEIQAITALVLTRDPLRPGLSFRARRERTILAFQRATTVLDECIIAQRAANQTTDHDLQSLRDEAMAFEPELAVARLRRSPNAFEAAVDLVYRIEQRVVEACGRASVFDRALLLVGRRYEAGRP